MKWGAIAVAVSLAASPGWAAEPTITEQAKALIARPPPADDVYRLKQDVGPERFKALNAEIARQVFHLPTDLKPGERTTIQACDPAGQRLLALIQMAMGTEAEAAWRSRMAEADGALKKWSTQREAADEATEKRIKANGADPRRAELARRFSRDQFVRTTLPFASPPGGWWDGVSGPVQQYLSQVAMAEMCSTDQDNTNWLKAEFARSGWPTITKAGRDADGQAFLLVQHADHDPAWQAQILAKLAELAPGGETNARNYAYLFDRVAMKHSGPQRYGTQGHCTGVGTWEPFADEPGDLDARRAAVGLPPEAEYIAGFKTRCFRADGV